MDAGAVAVKRDDRIVDRIHELDPSAGVRTVLVVETVANLVRMAGVLFDAIGDLLAPHGLSLAKFSLLTALQTAPGRCLRMADLGVEMSVTCPNITRLVDGLERDGLVRRGKLKGDRRVVLARLTAQGEKLVGCVVPELHAGLESLCAGLGSEECEELICMALRLRGSIERAPRRRRSPAQSERPAAEGCPQGSDTIDMHRGTPGI